MGILKQELCSRWDRRPFGHNRHGTKSGGTHLGELVPHITQCGVGQGLPPYQAASWSIQLCGHNRHWLKIGGCADFGGSWIRIQHNVARAEAYLHAKFHLDPSNRLATIHQHHRQDRQRSYSIGQTVLQTVAQWSAIYCYRNSTSGQKNMTSLPRS